MNQLPHPARLRARVSGSKRSRETSKHFATAICAFLLPRTIASAGSLASKAFGLGMTRGAVRCLLGALCGEPCLTKREVTF
jgi:hypothetical protein